MGRADENGYGRFDGERSNMSSSRIAYEQIIGSIPPSMKLKPTCHNHACVNPQHFYLCSNKRTIDDYEHEAMLLQNGCLIHPRKAKLARIVYELRHGPIPDGLEVCHKCDVPQCIRDEHHFLGTHHENMLDAAAKMRMFKSQDVRAKIGVANLGKSHPMSAEARSKISASNTGKIRSVEARLHLSIIKTGVSWGHHSVETKLKIGGSNMGKHSMKIKKGVE